MNTIKIKALVRNKTGQEPIQYDEPLIEGHFGILGNNDVFQYLVACLPHHSYVASQVWVHDLGRMLQENVQAASPGQYIYPLGYLIIATSTGGNAICLHMKTGHVCWADSSYFSEGLISFQDRSSGEWIESFEYTDDIVRRAMVWFEDDIERFLTNLLSDALTEQLEALDH
jgi:hypothetical protein